MNLPLVTSYSNLQLRLGYLKILAAMGTRTPTTNEAFERKLAPLFPPPPHKASALGPAAQDRPPTYIEQMFARLGHAKGLVNQHNLKEIVTLGKAFQFLHPGNCTLFEITTVLRAVMTGTAIKAIQERDATSGYNPLQLDQTGASRAEHAFFLVLILTTDLPVALAACVAAGRTDKFQLYDGFPGKREPLKDGDNAVRPTEKGPARSRTEESLVPYASKNILLDSYELLRPKATNQLSIRNWKDWVKYFEGDAPQSPFAKKKFLRMGKRSSFRHHAAPRLEFLVDLGLLDHDATASKEDTSANSAQDEDSDYTYRRNDQTTRFATFLKSHLLEQKELNLDKFVRELSIQCCAQTYGIRLRDPDTAERLQYLVSAYQTVKRDIGSTPMWTTALMGSLLALDAGVRLEIADLYAFARQKAQEERALIRLSGGSRFDEEFLITVSTELKETNKKGPQTE